MPILEPNIYALWGAKQTAKATAVAVASIGHRLVQVAGDFGYARDDGEENYSDLNKYGSSADWVNSSLGNGEPGIEATPDELAWLMWMYHGGETVTPVTGPPTAQKHTFTPSTARPHWGTWFRRVGLNVLQRHTMVDSLVTRIQVEGSTANKAVRATPRILSLDPFIVQTADPTAVMPTDKTFLYTDGSGLFTIDTVAFTGQSQFTLVLDEALEPVFGDDVVPFEVVQGRPLVTIGVTLYMDATALAQFNKLVYGTATPTIGTKPLKTLPALGSYSFYLKQRDTAGALNGREFKLTIPNVKWTPPAAPAPNPDGGATEIALAGAMRAVTSPAYTIDVNTANGTVAFTA